VGGGRQSVTKSFSNSKIFFHLKESALAAMQSNTNFLPRKNVENTVMISDTVLSWVRAILLLFLVNLP